MQSKLNNTLRILQSFIRRENVSINEGGKLLLHSS